MSVLLTARRSHHDEHTRLTQYKKAVRVLEGLPVQPCSSHEMGLFYLDIAKSAYRVGVYVDTVEFASRGACIRIVDIQTGEMIKDRD